MLIDPGQPNSSAMFLRMRSRNPSSQMPPLGTVLRDQTAVDALSRWITGDLAALARERRFSPALCTNIGTYRSDCSRQHPNVAAGFDLIENKDIQVPTLLNLER